MSEFEFYNYDQKERYLAAREDQYQKIRLVGRVFFKTTKPFEEELNKDCCNFTSKEILNMYASCVSKSWEHLLNFNSQLKIYTNWCLRENLVLDNQNHYEELDKMDMYRCLNIGFKESQIMTREELEHSIIGFYNVSEQFLVLALFEGIGGLGYKDFENLMPEQFKNGIAYLSDRELPVSNLLISKAWESATEYNKYEQDRILKVGYAKDDPSVVKDSCNASSGTSKYKTIRKIQRRIKMIENNYGPEFSYYSLKNSGRIHVIKELMKEDGSTDVRETYEKHKEEIEYRFGKLQRIFRWIEEYNKFFTEPS